MNQLFRDGIVDEDVDLLRFLKSEDVPESKRIKKDKRFTDIYQHLHVGPGHIQENPVSVLDGSHGYAVIRRTVDFKYYPFIALITCRRVPKGLARTTRRNCIGRKTNRDGCAEGTRECEEAQFHRDG